MQRRHCAQCLGNSEEVALCYALRQPVSGEGAYVRSYVRRVKWWISGGPLPGHYSEAELEIVVFVSS